MKRYRRLRRLQPDAELLRRRAAGEPFRQLAPAYGVSHTTLSRYFARPEVVQVLRAEQRLEREVRRKVRQQAAAERERVRGAELAAGRLAEHRSRRRAGGAYAAWLDQHDARLPLSRADLHSQNDLTAAHTVAAGGGMQAVIEATGLRTRENVLRSIDPTILEVRSWPDHLGVAGGASGHDAAEEVLALPWEAGPWVGAHGHRPLDAGRLRPWTRNRPI